MKKEIKEESKYKITLKGRIVNILANYYNTAILEANTNKVADQILSLFEQERKKWENENLTIPELIAKSKAKIKRDLLKKSRE